MRGWLVVPLLLLVTACGGQKAQCELTPEGLHLFVDDDAAPYPDVVGPVRAFRFDEVVRDARALRGTFQSAAPGRPAICMTDRTFPTVTRIAYAPRHDQHVGLLVELYAGPSGKVEVAEVRVMGLAP